MPKPIPKPDTPPPTEQRVPKELSNKKRRRVEMQRKAAIEAALKLETRDLDAERAEREARRRAAKEAREAKLVAAKGWSK